MEYIEMSQYDVDQIQGYNDLDNISNNILGLGKNAAKKAVKRKEKRLKKAEKKGNTKKVARLKKNIVKVQTKGTGMQRAAKTAGKIVRNIAGVTVLAPLQPFRKKMMDAISKAGGYAGTSQTDLATIAQRFYDTVVKKHDNSLEDYDFASMPEDHVAVLLPAIIDAIIGFFKKSKEKKDNGEPMSKLEKQAAEATEDVTENLKEKAADEAAGAVGKKILFDKKTQMIIVGVILAIIVIVFFIARRK